MPRNLLEFKRDVVRVAHRGDLSVAEVAADFYISVSRCAAGSTRRTSTRGSKTAHPPPSRPRWSSCAAKTVGSRWRTRSCAGRLRTRQRRPPKMMYPLVQEFAAEGFPVTVTSGVPGFSPPAFYKWQANPICERDWDDAHLTNAIVDIHGDDPEFGYRFIADELERAGHEVGEGRVQRLCREHRIWSTTTKKGRREHAKTPGPAVHDNLIQRRDFNAPAPDLIWLTDITEAPDGGRKSSTHLLHQRCLSRNRIVGYALGDHIRPPISPSAPCARRWPDASRPAPWSSIGQGRSISFQRIRGRAQGERPDRVDGPGLLRR